MVQGVVVRGNIPRQCAWLLYLLQFTNTLYFILKSRQTLLGSQTNSRFDIISHTSNIKFAISEAVCVR